MAFRFHGPRPPSRATFNAFVDQFAEALSAHGDIDRAAAEAGVSRGTGCVFLHTICVRLGEQAR